MDNQNSSLKNQVPETSINNDINNQNSHNVDEFFDAEEEILDEELKDVNLEQFLDEEVKDENAEKFFDEEVKDENEDDLDEEVKKENEEELFDDFVDENKLKEEELGLTEAQLEERLTKSKEFKEKGNDEFKKEEYRDSILSYTRGLLCCPLVEKEFRSVLYSNRSAAKVKLGAKESALDDCSKSLENNPAYLKVLLRRAKLYEDSDKLDEALIDYSKILELDPANTEAFIKTKQLPGQINERNEKLKTEMLGKLKDLGNMVLRPFGLSTNNFQMQQDPATGGYSINFQR